MTAGRPIKVLGIGAWDRSGSTVIANVMGAVPGVVSVGEINNLWERGLEQDRLCGCGARFGQCVFWQSVLGRAFPPDPAGRALLAGVVSAAATLSNGQLLRHGLMGGQWPAASAYGDGLRALYRAIAEVSGASVIVDSAKMPWHLWIASDLDGIDFSLLHLVRDPRGVTQALRKKMAYDPDTTRPELMDRHGTMYTALGWRYRNLMLGRLWRRSGSRYLLERYEDFATDPTTATRRILEMVGHRTDVLPFVSPNEAIIPPTHSVSGNPSRFASGTVRIALDNEWQSKLSSRRRLMVEALTWPMLTRYGYGE